MAGLGRLMRNALDFMADESGATIIEYAFIASMVSVAALSGFYQLGGAVAEMFDSIASSFVDALTGSD